MSLIFAMSILFFTIINILLIFLCNCSYLHVSMKIFSLGMFSDLELLISMWNLMFLMLVLIISFFVLFFSFSYMHSMKVNSFVFMYLSFVFSMSWLILNNNFYWMMLGWDGLGVVSFLLIVYYSNLESISNGLFTLFQNRIGDVFFVLFLVVCLKNSMFSSLFLSWGSAFLILGSAVKSAQFPFNAWLLSAMSAPTPVSSLVHSSTLVVAGVFILLQYSYCLMSFLMILKYISMVTLLLSSWGLLNESDTKKLIAYSTMSHVSLMMFLLSQKLFKVAYFHLNIHALFKSLMFMSFGFLMLSSFHSQDKRLVTMKNMTPHLWQSYYFACFSLAGLPFLTGFFSKDFILEKLIESSNSLLDVLALMIFLAISIYYSIKLLGLNKTMFSYTTADTQFLGSLSTYGMILMNILLVNVYISLVFSISLEISSFKFFIYFLMLIFMILSLLSNLNLKVSSYTKNLFFFDMKCYNFYTLDTYVYFSLFDLIKLMNNLSHLKIFILSNWWFMILVIFLW